MQDENIAHTCCPQEGDESYSRSQDRATASDSAAAVFLDYSL